MTRLRHPDSPCDRPVLSREEELPYYKPVQSVHLELHPGNLLDVSFRSSGDDAKRELFHPRREIVQTSEEAVNGEPRWLDEVLDGDELGALVHDREAREAAHRLVNFLQLARREFLTTPQPDRVAADDVVAGDHPRQRLGPAPFVRVDRRFGGDRILLERTDANAETPVVLDREADERTGPNAVRRRPVLREGYAEARISQLLDLPGFQFHDPCKYGTPPNTYAVRPLAATPNGKPLVAGTRPRPQLLSVSERSDRILPKPPESRRNRTEANGPPGRRPRRGRGSDREHRGEVRGPRRGRRPLDRETIRDRYARPVRRRGRETLARGDRARAEPGVHLSRGRRRPHHRARRHGAGPRRDPGRERMWLHPRARLVRSVPRSGGRESRRRDHDQDERGRSPPGRRTRPRRPVRAYGRYVRRPSGRRDRSGRIREPGRKVGRARDPSPDPRHRRVSAIHPGRRRGRPAAQRLLPGELRAGWLCMGVLEGRGRRECRNRREPLEDSRTRGREEVPRPVDRADPGPGSR